jgi:FkbM family methyltransferase
MNAYDAGMNAQQLPPGLAMLRQLKFPRKLGTLEILYGKALSRFGICWVRASNGVLWKLDLRDPTQRWIVFGDYEGAPQMEWLRGWLRGGGVVVDSGANLGQLCLYYGPMPAVKGYAFEPLPEAFEWLQACLGHHRDWCVSAYPYGLSDSDDLLTVQVDGPRSTARMDWYVGKELETIQIRTTTLDAFAQQEGISAIRLWKLDVEGHELEALRGARRLLSEQSIEAILIEVSSDLVLPFLREAGYGISSIDAGGRLRPLATAAFRGNCVATPIGMP